ncbi:Homeobox protein prophet of Pit-1 [Amphibalanus amphitrite]|uniref:Homeobox protein prophet of Pit-1 n=2 Tax=Amphibalanus amphitrite TaxID=1232801 RepID=A0A6A4VQ02_AMPAM|nr:Homeobox protein prophet of Pit-1 [Amphibalanus amphitrite]
MVRHELFAAGPDDVYCPAHAAAGGGAVPPGALPLPPGALPGQPSYVPPGRPGRGRRRGARKTGARLPAELSESRRKRHRIQFSAQQLRELQTSFGGNPNPDSKAIFDLAGRLGLGKQHVQVWFQNRRAKERRLKSESPQSES